MGICVHILPGADSHDYDGDGDDHDSDVDGVGDGNYSTCSTELSRLATTTSDSKIPQTLRLRLANVFSHTEVSISQKLPMEISTPPDARLSPEGSQAGFQIGFQSGSQASFQAGSQAGSEANSQL